MNNLQNVEFDILKEFVRICDELGLRYYLVCGSCLGAVKYQGFIPWDDDIDVALPRPDYEIFCERAQRMLPGHLFLQNHMTEKDYPRMYSKIRNSNTTYIEKSSKNIQINHGVYIDVFPLDGYPSRKKDIKRLERLKKKYKLQLECTFDVDYGVIRNTFFRIERLLKYDKKSQVIVERLTEILKSWSVKDSLIWCNHGNWQEKLEYSPSSQYGDGSWGSFEGLKVKIPDNFDAYLTQKYGDWRSDLPAEEQVGHHYYSICDLDRPYTYYLNKDNNNTK